MDNVRNAFEDWAAADNRRLEGEEYEERTPDNNHYYADDTTNHAYVGWCAALTALHSRGLAVVPVEVTKEMREAYWNAPKTAIDVWPAMLAARPEGA